MPICPDCRADKHGNCDDSAWSDEADDIVACECAKADHRI